MSRGGERRNEQRGSRKRTEYTFDLNHIKFVCRLLMRGCGKFFYNSIKFTLPMLRRHSQPVFEVSFFWMVDEFDNAIVNERDHLQSL